MRGYVQDVIIAIGRVMDMSDTSQIGPETRLEYDLGFDSGLFIELIMHLEDHIPGLTIDPALLRREDFLTVGSTAGFIAGRVRSPGGIL